jgi:hypothetical protein
LLSAFAPIPCPPDVPILTLTNGDAIRDGHINRDDYDFVKARLGTTDPEADLNGDGKVNDDDLAIVKAHMGLQSDTSWQGSFPQPQGWYVLQFAVQLEDYVGDRLEYAEQPDGSYVAPRGVYSQLRFVGGRYELVRLSQERWVFEPVPGVDNRWRLVAIKDLHNQGVVLHYNDANQLVRIADSVGRAVELALDEACFACEGVGVLFENLSEGVLDWCCKVGSVAHSA